MAIAAPAMAAEVQWRGGTLTSNLRRHLPLPSSLLFLLLRSSPSGANLLVANQKSRRRHPSAASIIGIIGCGLWNERIRVENARSPALPSHARV